MTTEKIRLCEAQQKNSFFIAKSLDQDSIQNIFPLIFNYYHNNVSVTIKQTKPCTRTTSLPLPPSYTPTQTLPDGRERAYNLARHYAETIAEWTGLELVDQTGLNSLAQTQPKHTLQHIAELPSPTPQPTRNTLQNSAKESLSQKAQRGLEHTFDILGIKNPYPHQSQDSLAQTQPKCTEQYLELNIQNQANESTEHH